MINTTLFDNVNRVALAVSGGKDSMALLYDMARLFPHDFFYVINVEHGIRGEESVSDSAFVLDYARSLGVEAKSVSVDAVTYSRDHGYTLEQGARLLRREIFAHEVSQGNADRVVVAHHMDDNAESILMHIARGSGVRGLRGMMADDGILLRPMLGVTREEIDEYIASNNIPFVVDATNADTAYTRNFLRHEVMPLLKSRYPNILESFAKVASSAKEDDELLMEMASELVSNDGDRVIVDICAKAPILKRAFYMAFSRLGVHADIEERHYNLLLDLIDANNGTSLDMPYGVTATKEYDHIAMTTKGDVSHYDEVAFCLGEINVGNYVIEVEEVCRDNVNYLERNDEFRTLYVDGELLNASTIRMRKEGDVFHRFRGGNKKLKDYFIDIKLPRAKRDIPIIARDNVVLAVIGYDIADEISISDNTKKIYRISIRRQTYEQRL